MTFPPGRDRLAVFLERANKLVVPGEVRRLEVHHDDGCPCLVGRSMASCTCKSVDLEVRP